MPHSKADWLEDPEYMAELRKSLMNIAVGKMPRVSDAEEVVQRTLQALIESSGRVRLQTTPLQYAIGILRNKVRDYYRALRKPHVEELDENLRVSESPEDYVNVEELREAIRRSIVSMSEECRRIFAHLYLGRTVSEIQERLNTPSIDALKMRISRCRQELRKLLEGRIAFGER